MKRTIKQLALILFVSLTFGLVQKANAQWATNGNNASGASPSTPNEFIGTLNNFNLNFKINSSTSSTVRMTLNTVGFLGAACAGCHKITDANPEYPALDRG